MIPQGVSSVEQARRNRLQKAREVEEEFSKCRAIVHLREEVTKLKSLLVECGDDLEDWVKSYGGSTTTHHLLQSIQDNT